jgi:hypothetical protein
MRRNIQFRLNGESVETQVAPHETLVEVLQAARACAGAARCWSTGLLFRAVSIWLLWRKERKSSR